jgi:SAM-dependent methyltransferase
MFTLIGREGRLDLPLPTQDGEFQAPDGNIIRQLSEVLDLVEGEPSQMADHYTDQWGAETDFQLFARQNPEAMRITVGRQLGWPDLFDRIRVRARDNPILVYDAACGFGGVLDLLFAKPSPSCLYYLGADIHRSLATVRRPKCAEFERVRLVRWDISRPLPVRPKFDFVICRSAIHHTPDPPATFRSLVDSLAASGTLAISAYAKKSRPREAIDEYLRAEISQMPVTVAKEVSREFSLLARDIQQTKGRIRISKASSFLGIPGGDYSIHDFIYRFFMKNWYNAMFGLKFSDLVNFDWYHPQFAYRYTLDELRSWFTQSKLEITHATSTEAQHYMEGIKRE